MGNSVLPSTFLLTLLLAVGLFFFIRASFKDRTQSIRLVSEQPEESLLVDLQEYFTQRAYRIAGVSATQNQVTFEGFVRPSLALATFLTLLAAIGLLCLVLMLSVLFPNFSQGFLGLLVLSPLAGYFYWRGAGRVEQVLLRVEELSSLSTDAKSAITVVGHRDELAELQRALPLKLVD